MRKSGFIDQLLFTNPKKGINAVKVYLSFLLSQLLRKPIQWGYPITVSIEPTTSCNLRCPECPSGLRSFSRPTGMLKFDVFKQTIDQIKDFVSILTFYFQGEPYLNKDFLAMVAYANRKGIYTATSTNGHYLDTENARLTVESGLKRLIISIDGTTQEVYEKYRVGGDLEKVKEGIRQVMQWKQVLKSKYPRVIIQFLVVKPNEHQISAIQHMADELGVDELTLKTAQIYNYGNGSPLIPDNGKYSRYKKNPDGTYQIKNTLNNKCWKLWSSCVITWDAEVLPCCFDKDAKYKMGNILNESFKNIWDKPQYYDFRSKLLVSRKEIDICTNCSEGLDVWAEA